MSAEYWDRPCAAQGLASYRCKGRYGWIMIGAKNHADALREARRSCDVARREDLEVWDGSRYVPAKGRIPAKARKASA